MSGSNIDDDTLISQDDIDKLLSSLSPEESESANGDSEKGLEEDVLGELSQDDIDNLLNNASQDVDPFEDKLSSEPEPRSETDPADMELFSQDDIDRLMNSAVPDEKASAALEQPVKLDEPDPDDMELFSQDDIDRLMNSAVPDEKASAVVEQPVKLDEPDPDDMELFSQDDIDRLMNSAAPEEKASADLEQPVKLDEPDPDDMELFSQDDIDRLMNSVLPDEKASAGVDKPVKLDEPDPDNMDLVSQDDIDRLMNSVPSGEKALTMVNKPDAADMDLVSQDDIDRLMNSVLPDDNVSTAIDVEIPGQNTFEPDDEILIDVSQSVAIDGNLISQEIIDRLLSEPAIPPPPPPAAPPEPAPPAVVPKEQDPVEDDIGDLLKEEMPVDDSEENNLISQDDIDDLLKDSEQEDEDIIGDWDGDGDFTVDREDGDPEDRQVVLEEAEETLAGLAGISPEELTHAGKRYGYKKVLALSSVFLVFLVAISLGLYKYFNRETIVAAPPQVAEVSALPEPSAPPEQPAAVVAIDLTEQNKAKGGGTLVLEDFVVLVPGKTIGISYISASLSIDYLDQRAAAEINSHLSLYRDVIFNAMGLAIESIKVDKITEADLLSNIKEELNRVLPDKYVERVTFAAFTTG